MEQLEKKRDPMDQASKKAERETKKEYLRRYLRAQQAQGVIEQEIIELRLELYPSGVNQDGMPHGSGGRDLSGYIAALDELDQKLKVQVEKKIRLRKEITERIDAMPNETESLLLRLRYIHGLRWNDVATDLSYSKEQTLRLHKKALENFRMTPNDTI